MGLAGLSQDFEKIHTPEAFMAVWDSLINTKGGVFQRPVGDWEEPTEKYYFEVLESGDSAMIFSLSYPMAFIWHTQAKYSLCIPLFEYLLKQPSRLNEKQKFYSFLKLEEAYLRSGLLAKAIPLRQQRIDLGYANSFWEIYASAGLYQEAIRDFNIYEKRPLKGWKRMLYYLDLARLFLDYEVFDSAIFYYQKAHQDGLYIASRSDYHGISNYSEVNKHYWVSYCFGQIGHIYVKQGKYQQAIPLLKNDIEVSKSVYEVDNTLIKRLDLATCYLSMGQPNTAGAYIDTVKQLVTGKGWLHTNLQLLEVESEYLIQKGNFELANKRLKAFNHLNDSLVNQRNKNSLIVMTAILDTDRQKEMVARQKRDLEEVKALERAKTNQLNLLVFGVVMLLIILVLLYINNRQKLRSKRAIELRLKEKEVLLKEIHHRVKNNLQITSGLLQLQVDKSGDQKTNAVLLESQGRIKSMAMIHNLLLSEKNISAVSLKEYIEKLISLISMGYGRNKKIEIEMTLADLELNSDMAIPLGLIINEIITNSYKYAFDGEGGKIIINHFKGEGFEDVLEIKDDGKGFPENFDYRLSNSLGMELIEMLAQQIRAKLKIFNQNGAVYQITLKPA